MLFGVVIDSDLLWHCPWVISHTTWFSLRHRIMPYTCWMLLQRNYAVFCFLFSRYPQRWAVFEILIFQIRIWNTFCIWYLKYCRLNIWYFGILNTFLSVDVFVQILHSKYFFQILSTYFQHATSSNHVEACVYLPCAVVLVQWAEYCLSNVVM